jgi:hypothetical protein
MYVQAGFFANDKRNGTRLRERVLAGSVGSVDHSSDEETKTATLPSGNRTELVDGNPELLSLTTDI